jgi:hypothetical protein
MLTLYPTNSNTIVASIILSAITSVMLLGNPATAPAVPESAKTLQARTTSPISVQTIFEYDYNANASAETTIIGCNDWICDTGSGKYGVDMYDWCVGSWVPGAYASCRNGVYSWMCNH